MSTITTPYELNQGHTHSPFVTFETTKVHASWPWHAVQAIHITPDKTLLTFEFVRHSVELTGENLGIIENEARTTRLKTLREGSCAGVTVRSLRLIGV